MFIIRILILLLGATCGFVAFVGFSVFGLQIYQLVTWEALHLSNQTTLAYCGMIYAGLVAFLCFTPVGGWMFDIQIGVRKPSGREQEVLTRVENDLLNSYRNVLGGSRRSISWRVIDQNDYQAFAYGLNRIAVSRALLQESINGGNTEYQTVLGVAAHELGHHHYGDCRHMFFFHLLTWPLGLLGVVCLMVAWIPLINIVFGLIALIALIPMKIAYFINGFGSRSVEYRADRFAFQITGPVGLLRFFDAVGMMDNRSGSEIIAHYQQSHPPVELRRDALVRLSQE